MSKNKERACPACHRVSAFRADQKTCGCPKSKPSNRRPVFVPPPVEPPAKDPRLISMVQERMKPSVVKIERPESNFPELIVTVPDGFGGHDNCIQLAPMYDVHIGSIHHDRELWAKHLKWLIDTPNVLTWNGGDMIENASKLSVGAGVYEQDYTPQNQLAAALRQLSRVRHKMLFALPGNHEDRCSVLGVDVAQWLAWMLKVEYFHDFAFCTIKWRGNNYRLCAHHGSGGAATAGAQRMAARKSLSWAKPFDLYWTGHLHNALADMQYQTDFNQATGRMVERSSLVMISPSYLNYYGSYAASKQLPPGTRGLSVVKLRESGKMEVSIHAKGERL